MTNLIRSFRRDFLRSVAEMPDFVVLVDGRSGSEMTWREVDETTNRITGFLRSAGVGEGDVVASNLPNSMEHFLIFVACLKSGLAFSPIPPKSTAAELDRLSSIIQPKIFLSPTESPISEDRWPGLDGAQKKIAPDGKFEWLRGFDATGPQSTQGQSSQIFVLSGGTTAEPKVVVIDADRLWSAGCAFVDHHEFLDPDCRFYNIMPMSYLGGLFNLGLIPMAAQARTVIAEPFSGLAILRLWRNCERFGINVLWLVPTVARALVQAANRDDARLAAGVKAGKKYALAFRSFGFR